MSSRGDRFTDEDLDGILIDDAESVIKANDLQSVGFNRVLDHSYEEALEMLEEDMEESSLLKAAWKEAKRMLKANKREKGELDILYHECQVAIVAFSLETPNLYSDFNQKSREMLTMFDWEAFPYRGMWLLMHNAVASPAGRFGDTVNLYRGCKVRISVKVGSAIKFQQITSTTTNREVAEEFAKGGTLFVIQAIHALGIRNLSAFPEEEEFLITPSDGFTVTKIKQTSDVRKIYLESIRQSFLF